MDERERLFLKNKGLVPEDYYFNEHGLLIFTEHYHLKRGYCCRSRCRHCPYGAKTEKTDPPNKDSDAPPTATGLTEW
jgi:hypothetical protein